MTILANVSLFFSITINFQNYWDYIPQGWYPCILDILTVSCYKMLKD